MVVRHFPQTCPTLYLLSSPSLPLLFLSLPLLYGGGEWRLAQTRAPFHSFWEASPLSSLLLPFPSLYTSCPAGGRYLGRFEALLTFDIWCGEEEEAGGTFSLLFTPFA